MLVFINVFEQVPSDGHNNKCLWTKICQKSVSLKLILKYVISCKKCQVIFCHIKYCYIRVTLSLLMFMVSSYTCMLCYMSCYMLCYTLFYIRVTLSLLMVSSHFFRIPSYWSRCCFRPPDRPSSFLLQNKIKSSVTLNNTISIIHHHLTIMLCYKSYETIHVNL